MSIKKLGKYEHWEFENKRFRKSLPSDIIPEKPGNPEEEECLSFLLTLTMIFNDLKGLVVLNDTIQSIYRQSDGIELSEHTGEHSGIRLQLLKLLFATLHETLEFIRVSKKIYEMETIQRLLRSTSNDTQLVWKMLNKVDSNNPIDDAESTQSWVGELRGFLVKARNNVGFHYQTRKQILEGYRRFFFKGIANVPENARKFAYRSVNGTDFAASRYYYADAALQGYYINLFGDEKLAQQRTDEVFKLMNFIIYAIHDLLIQHHDSLPNR